jgi:prepilin peptidase CpaA
MLQTVSFPVATVGGIAVLGQALLAPASAAAVAAMVLAAASDVEQRRVPDILSSAVALSGVAALPAFAPADAVAAVALAVATAVAAIICFARGWFGGGDAKLLSATMLWTGTGHLALFAVAMALASIAVAALLGVSRALAAPGAEKAAAPSLPLAVPIACGGIVAIADRLALLPLAGG